jgi:tetratricopeptide (TPR) repeat protein
MATQAERNRAFQLNKVGLAHYEIWEMDRAVAAFTAAVANAPDNPEYHLNLTRAYTRGGHYDQAMEALGGYLQTETKSDVAARYERLFSTALDDVEVALIEGMKKLEMPVEQIGKGIQMWLEYRITVGRRPLRIQKPELWAAAIAHAMAKVNFVKLSRTETAAAFNIAPQSLKTKYDDIVAILDLMPADYRYFTGKENPLDKLVEAAQLLEELDRQFQEEE